YNRSTNPYEGRFRAVKFESPGRIALEGSITEDTDAFFTPALYKIAPTSIIDFNLKNDPSEKTIIKRFKNRKQRELEIFSLRGRFTEHAKKGERVFLNGKLELVSGFEEHLFKNGDYFRIVLGVDNRDQFYLL
ncbi:MAG: hypothetical protein ACTSWY_08540, partial [Promethearchaeota archaeon]